MSENQWAHEYTLRGGLAGLLAWRAARAAVQPGGSAQGAGPARVAPRDQEGWRLAQFLRTLGLIAGDKVVVLLRDPSLLPLALGAAIQAQAGIRVLPAGQVGANLADELEQDRPRVIITESACTALLYDSSATIVDLDTDAGYWDSLDSALPDAAVAGDARIAVSAGPGRWTELSNPDLLAEIAALQAQRPLSPGQVLQLAAVADAAEWVRAALWCTLSGALLRQECSPMASARSSAGTQAAETPLSRPASSAVSASGGESAAGAAAQMLRDKPVQLAATAAASGAAVSALQILPVRSCKALARLADTEHLPLSDLLVAAWAALLHRFADEKQIAVATLPNETGADSGLCGRIVTPAFSDDISFRSLLRQCCSAREMPYPGAGAAVETGLAQARDAGFNRLSQFAVRYYGKGGKDEASRNRADQRCLESFSLDSVCRFERIDNRLRYVLTCRESWVANGLAERLADSFATLVQHLAEQPDAELAALPVLPARQLETQVHAWNDTGAPFDENACVHQLFERQAALQPQLQAIYDHASALSYGELNEQANRLARFIGTLSAAAPQNLCVMLDRRVDIPVALLAILKSGNAYVPLDAQHPAQRNAGIVREQAAQIIITHACYRPEIDALVAADSGIRHVVYLDSVPSPAGGDAALHGPDAWAQCLPSNLDVRISADGLAYTIFTSGSTGKPKGVMVRHRPVVNLIEWVNRTFRVGAGDTLLFVTSLCFDLSVYDIFGVLAAGGRIRVATTAAIRDARALLDLLQQEPITFWDSAPANLQRLAPLLSDPHDGKGRHNLRLVFLSGDWIPVKLPDRLRAAFPNAHIVSLGGATEATVWSNYYPIGKVAADWGSIPYGRPIQNARYYILNRRLQPCPVEVAGDLYIGGLCLADGYTSEELTQRSFITDPFVGAPARMYRTGDLARFEADGTMIFLGRADTQVKVRGFRVELGEIEVVLQQHPAVDHAVVLLQDRNTADPRIVAYVAARDRDLDHLQLRRYLEKFLPDPMLPNFSLVMPSLPVNANGKVDRAALPWPLPGADERPVWSSAGLAKPVPAVSQMEQSHQSEQIIQCNKVDKVQKDQSAADDVRHRVFGIVTELLHHSELAEGTSLFEAGATSLTIVFLAERIKQQYGVEIPIDRFLAEPTVTLLLTLLAEQGFPASADAVPAQAPGQPAAADLAPAPVSTAPGLDGSDNDAGLERAVALIGMHFNFPGAADIDSFWQKLVGRQAFYGPLPSQRSQLWNGDPARTAAASFVGAYVDDIDCFDHRYFGISAPEARSMDPQERRLMESAVLCLEDAGYSPDSEALGRVGVYCGVMREDYASLGIEHWNRTGQTAFASNASGVSNRISHSLGLKGPSLTVNTSCASALTALHLACNALRHGECDTALVGGVNLFAHPYHHAMLHGLRFASARGSAEPFGAAADGWVPGEGVATLLLKPSAQAIRDRDFIHAHVLGSVIGHMGSTLQYAAPSAAAQSEGLRQLLRNTGVRAASIDLVECCAAGAALGDAAEFSAIQQVIADEAGEAAWPDVCYLGTSKDYLGHLESASALAQIIKALLQLRHNRLIPLRVPAPLSPLVVSRSERLQLLTDARPWQQHADGRARTVLVNSNGAGGATAHLLLAEHRPRAAVPAPAEQELIVLSSMSEAQLREQAASLCTYIQVNSPALADVAFTLAAGRRHHAVRLALVVNSAAELVEHLAAFAASPPRAGEATAVAVEVAAGWLGVLAPNAAPAAADTADHLSAAPAALAALARRWCCGEASLGGLIGSLAARGAGRISLPGFRFIRHRHWLPVVAGEAVATGAHLLPAPSSAGNLATAGGVPATAPHSEEDGAGSGSSDTAALANLQQFLVELVARATETPPQQLHLQENTQRYGLNSLSVTLMTGQLGQALGITLEPTLFFAHKTLAGLAAAVFAAQRAAVLARFGRWQSGDSVPPAFSQGSCADQAAAPAEAAPPAVSAAAGEAPIAVVGVAGRYPGAPDLIAFWENLREARDCISEIPAERWDADDYLPEGVPPPPQGASRWGGFIDDVDKFDPLFFGIAPSTADFMDPQVRLFLQTAWAALEDAGHSSACLKRFYDGEVGVFVGVMHGEYQLHDARTAEGVRHLGGVSHGSVAHQVSYTLDLSGPSLAVDTMCSASLTALHLAVGSIRRQECKAAIVGGVNVSIHPNKYVQQSLMTMHSRSGRCRAFAAEADGFIPAEGVGAILIKPLQDALRDRDQIYALIRGSHINAGGKTFGYTVPSPAAQAALIGTALRSAGVDPSAVSYIEAHGTGTALGDPIEISGLTEAFYGAAANPPALRARGQFCAIGSVKSNIGHCESAAGIAGLTKVLLQLRHKVLVPSLHAGQLNPSIDFDNSPFRVQRDLADWPAPRWLQDGLPRQAPRIAGISSFGAGGANAHVLVEEFPAPVRSGASPGPTLVLLSARSRAQLEQSAAALKRGIRHYAYTDADLPSIGFTLATGRDPHTHRLALIAGSLAELLRQLDAFLAGRLDACYRPIANRRADSSGTGPQQIAELLQQGSLQPLADAWLGGQEIDWWTAYAALPGHWVKCSLPGYPFLRKSCWLGGRFEPQQNASSAAPALRLHPLVHQNISDFRQFAFLSTFAQDEFILRDHQLGGRCLLPGVAHLEMARAAASLLGGAEDGETVFCLRGVVWMQPVVLQGRAVRVRTELRRDARGKLRFALLSPQDGQPERLHSQGEIEVLPAAEAAQPAALHMAQLQGLCGQQRIGADAFYRNALSGGAQYGPAFQALTGLALSQDAARPFVLADVQLPQSVAGDREAWQLHPSIMDAALQAVAALSGIAYPGTGDSAGGAGMALPFALEELRVYAVCPARCVVWARPGEPAGANASVSRFDIDIADVAGRVAVTMRGYTTRALPAPAVQSRALSVMSVDWSELPAAAAEKTAASDAGRVVCLVGLRGLPPLTALQGALHLVDSDQPSPEARYGAFITQIIDICRRAAAEGKGKRTVCVVVQSETADSALMAGLAGLLASIEREYASITTRLVGFSILPAGEALEARLRQEIEQASPAVFHAGGRRLERRLSPLGGWQQLPKFRWPPGGVYLITGGLGGIGRLLARHVAAMARPATLVLAGRKPLDREIQVFIDATSTAQVRIVYESMDVADEAAVDAALTNLRQHYGAFTGVLHCAGVSRDSLIINKTAQDIHAVLAAKVAGTANIDRATRQDPLQFFVVFSSLSSLFGNPGQADYAAANGYLDGYVHERARRVRAGQGAGYSASVNWPFWENGGMQPGPAARTQMTRQQMLPMADADALALLEQLAMTQSGQWAVISHAAALESPTVAVPSPAPRPPADAATHAATVSDAALQRLQQRLIREVSAQLKIDEADLDADSDFSEYGFDSISLTEFANRVSQMTGLSLLPTIFFEYPNIAAFAGHLLAAHGDALGESATVADRGAAAGAAAPAPAPAAAEAAAAPRDALQEALYTHVLSAVSSLLKIDAQDLDLDTELSEYGFDSINLTELSSRLQAFFDVAVMPTIFFEHPTLRRFCDYLAATHADAVSAALVPPGGGRTAAAAAPPHRDELPVPAARSGETSNTARAPRSDREPIAIIGMSGAFPRARSIDAFWNNLADAVDGISEIPPDRWDWRAVYGNPLTEPNKTNVKYGGFIDGVGDFDPAFFGISPREALYMDPQQRLLMLHAWHAIEDAGHAPESLAGSDTAIFVGTTVSGYVNLIAQSGHAIQSYSATGISPSVGPNRLSFLLDLHGPSEPIETACSSSLVAIHRAVTALRMQQCELALAGGVNTIVTPEVHISFNKAGMLSQDGRCKTFSSNADGYSRGEGVGMLVLRRLSDAQHDRDPIYAVILASAENHGGKASTLTSPNPVSQAMLLKAAYREAGIDPRTLTYIECHGTGTELGDPVEINGLKSAFHELYDEALRRHGPFRSGGQAATPWCGLASVKSNIGHLEYAAGVAGVIKVLLQMRHRTLVPSLHSVPRNPYIQLDNSPFEILSERRPWTALHDDAGRPLPRRAGVSSYGFGGVNAHVVIEEYPPVRVAPAAAGPVAVLLSARTEAQLIHQATQLRDTIAQRGYADSDLADIAYTLQVGRNAMRHRFGCSVADVATLQQLLEAFAAGEASAGRWMSGDAKADKAEVSAFARDAEFQTLVSSWSAQRKYPQLIKLWVAGHAIDWKSAADAAAVPPSRISLPGYAFELRRYWIDALPLERRPHPAAEATAAAEAPAVPGAAARPATAPVVSREGKPQVRLLDAGQALDAVASASAAPLSLASQAAGGRAAIVLDALGEAGSVPPAAPLPAAGRRLQPVAAPPSAPAVLESLRQTLAEALFMDLAAVDIELPFNEMGLDSVTGVEWVQSVNKAFGLKIAAAEVFNYPTLVLFAAFVAEGLKQQNAKREAVSQPRAAAAASPALVPPAVPEAVAPGAQAAPPGAAAPPRVATSELLQEVTQFLQAQLVDVLYLDNAVHDLDLPFSDLGLDSVTGVEWVQAINARFSIKLAASELFNHPTLRRLSQRIGALMVQSPAVAVIAPPAAVVPRIATPPLPVAVLPPGATVAAEAAVAEPAAHAAAPGPLPGSPAANPAARGDAIAVIGMACRFADASSPVELWRNLADGRDSVRQADRWPDFSNIGGKPLLGSFLADIGCFDPMFFKISASEAKYMDPQQRVFLEECWKAIEDAGYAGCIEGANCGVYAGCGNGDYGALMSAAPPQAFWGNAMSVIASRISYYLDLHGPAVAIDTACSSSLVAIHTACRALAGGEVDLALAGGVTVLSTPSMIGNAAGAGMLSPTGRCHSFDSRADGFVAGEGAGVLLLKRMSDALRDKDNIHGVIRGSAINQDGLTNGITAPSAKAQERLESEVYARFGIDPASISLVEAHGTGTILGDPIEFQALCEAFRKHTPRRQFCALGSIKSNLGHTIAAAGVAGVLKVLLALKHRQLPPSLHFREGNPGIDFGQSPFYVNTRLREWQVESGSPRRAAVSSFGFSGTNAHAVIDEAPALAPETYPAAPQLVVLSAHSVAQLTQLADALAEHLDTVDLPLACVAYTLALGRRQLPYRIAVVAVSTDELRSALLAWRRGTHGAQVHSNASEPAVYAAAAAAPEPLSLAALERETGLGLDGGAGTEALLQQAAMQFVGGRKIEFRQFFATPPRRVSLPVYTFAKEHYWIDSMPPPAPQRAQPGAARPSAQVPDAPGAVDEDWLLESLYEGSLSVDDVLKALP